MQLLEGLQPVLAQLTSLEVASSRWQRQTQQVDSLRNVLDLALTSGNEDSIVKELIKGTY